jgi:hypothetical protein
VAEGMTNAIEEVINYSVAINPVVVVTAAD